MTDYQIVCVIFWAIMDTLVVAFICYVAWSVVKYETLRLHILQAAQNGDGVTHWSDGRNVVSLVLGLFSAWFTGNLVMLFVTYKLFDAGPAALVATFVAITFTLLQIAWKKNVPTDETK